MGWADFLEFPESVFDLTEDMGLLPKASKGRKAFMHVINTSSVSGQVKRALPMIHFCHVLETTYLSFSSLPNPEIAEVHFGLER